MEKEKLVKTHLIVTDVHDEFSINWCGKLNDTKPLLKNGLPVFAIVSSAARVELNTIDIKLLERCAKRITRPKGRSAVTTDKAYIYVKEIDGHETRVGIVTHDHVKTFKPMYDKVGYRDE